MLSKYILLPVVDFVLNLVENYPTVHECLSYVRDIFVTENVSVETRLNNYYKFRSKTYDATRTHFLHSRGQLIRSCLNLVTKKDGLIWVDVGCGTGCLLRALTKSEIERFACIYMVDICEPLLQIAEEYVKENDIQNVKFVRDLATHGNLLWELEGKVDLCTCSYSLSMMEDWMHAVERVTQWLAPDGICGVVDFYISKKRASQSVSLAKRQHSIITRTILPPVFAYNNIFLTPHMIDMLHLKFTPLTLQEKDFGMPYFFPVLACPYFMFIGRMNGVETR